MFGRNRTLPISEEMRTWVDGRLQRLEFLLGRNRMLAATVILAQDQFFPDPYRGTLADVEAMARRVAGYMGIAPDVFRIQLYAEGEEAVKASVPLWSGSSNDAAGLYVSEAAGQPHTIGVHAKQVQDPERLVAVLTHELAHVLLLGGGLIDREEEDMEPLTDLATVYLGMGVLNARAAYQFTQYTDTRTQGWSTRRLGYLTEDQWGYALAWFAHARGETKPAWRVRLPTNIRVPFDQTLRWFQQS